MSLSFEQAVMWVKQGKKVTRGKGHVYLVPASSYPKTRNTLSGVEETSEMVEYAAYLARFETDRKITTPYAFTAEDILDDKWSLVE